MKYGNQKTRVCGITFDSKREAERYLILQDMQRRGEITELALQVPFELIPAQKDDAGRVAERAVTYIADFVYWTPDGFVVEDAKGCKTEVYRIKKKLMRWIHGIEIREV